MEKDEMGVTSSMHGYIINAYKIEFENVKGNLRG
jgi:hypothetical protein